MRIVYHPDFPKDIKRFEAQYHDISDRLAERFRVEVDDAIERIKASPASAGHFLNTGSKIVKEVRAAICPRSHFSSCMACTMICWCSAPSFRVLLTH